MHRCEVVATAPSRVAQWADAAQAWMIGAAAVVAWSGLNGQMTPSWRWLSPGLVLAAWSAYTIEI